MDNKAHRQILSSYYSAFHLAVETQWRGFVIALATTLINLGSCLEMEWGSE